MGGSKLRHRDAFRIITKEAVSTGASLKMRLIPQLRRQLGQQLRLLCREIVPLFWIRLDVEEARFAGGADRDITVRVLRSGPCGVVRLTLVSNVPTRGITRVLIHAIRLRSDCNVIW